MVGSILAMVPRSSAVTLASSTLACREPKPRLNLSRAGTEALSLFENKFRHRLEIYFVFLGFQSVNHHPAHGEISKMTQKNFGVP